MRVAVQSVNVDLSESLHAHVRRKIAGIGRMAGAVRSIIVRLADHSAKRGRNDLMARAVVRVDSGPVLVIDERSDNLYRAVDALGDRLRHALARRLHRRPKR